MEQEHIGIRIRLFREAKGMKQLELAANTNIKQTTISSIENGTEPKAGVIARLLLRYPDLNPDWLLTGNGLMLRDDRGIKPLEGSGASIRSQQAPPPSLDTDPYTKLLMQENEALRTQNDKFIQELQATNRISQEQISMLLEQLTKKP